MRQRPRSRTNLGVSAPIFNEIATVTFFAKSSPLLHFDANPGHCNKVQTLKLVLEPKNVARDDIGAEPRPFEDDGI